ncbi:unnamed protein product [Meloidogyne enterolobii]|uniref:Uncharacterized protein n=1 Tax=Meloidogyne enterolobii TaxID=390850 RepID=A0ACB1B8L9_MELEN
MNFYSETNFNPNFDTTDSMPHTSSSFLTCNTTDLDKEAVNPVSSKALSSSGSSNQNVCAHCGFEIYEPISSKDKAPVMITNLPHLPLHDAALMNKKDDNVKLFRSHDEDTSEWIFCDICRKWFHANCVDIQQYEMPLIDKYHCPSCRFEHGDSIMKVKRLFHRYVFDDESQRALPIQIGTEAWTHNFKNEYRKIPEVTCEMIDLYDDGRQLMQNFNFLSKWTKPIKVKNCKGLGLRMPDDPYFDILDVIKLLVDENPTWQKHFGRANESDHQHESSRPYVENFCLLGMRGSYTDFHIDFGGSSVWYHVFRGSKIFFIAPPTPENLQAFLNWQNDKERSEKFFGDLLPNGGKIYRLEVGERETLLLPSGWIHSVYTPEDSIVFGGNFLHSLNVDLQLSQSPQINFVFHQFRVYDIELAVETDERFKFPFFELCNIYAAKSFAESIKECGQLADQFQIDVATLLLEKCSKWIQEADKFSIFKGTLKQLEKQLERQTNLQRRIKAHNPAINSTNMPAISPSSQCSPLRQPELEIQDLDSSWDQDDVDDCNEQEDDFETIADDSDNNSDSRTETGKELSVSQQPSTSANNVNGLVDAVSDIDSEGHIRLKIKLPCWHQKPDNEKKQVNNNVIADEDEADIGAMFSGRSIHGRQIRPTSRISTLGGITMDDQKGDVFDFVPGTASITSKNVGHKDFISSFALKERPQMHFTDKAGYYFVYFFTYKNILAEKNYKNELFLPLNKQKRKKMNANSSNIDFFPNDLFTSTSSTSSNKEDSVIQKKPKKTSAINSRERLAKKLGLMRKK